MKEKTIYNQPQVEVVDIFPEKAYCSPGGTGEDTNNKQGGWD